MVDLGSPKQRSVLALLLINANTVVSVDRILDEIWGEEAVDRKSALQVYISRLRSALEPERKRGDSSILETREPGYLLHVDAESFDVARFEQLVGTAREAVSADPASAVESFTEASALWTGDAYADFTFENFAQDERARLDEMWLSATEDRIDAELAIGRSGQLVSELETLRREHPLRSRFVGQLMLALYRSGRAPESLRTIGRYRRLLAEELGLEPAPELLHLEEQILLHDSSIQLRDRVDLPDVDRPRDAPNPYKGLQPFGSDDAVRFYGRDALVAEMVRNLSLDKPLTSIIGASGSGKSSAVRAGLLPALAKGVIEGSESWLIATMMPGSHPFAELEAALLRTTINGPDSLSEQLSSEGSGLLRAALCVLPSERSRLVLVIDQLEELFTLSEPNVRRRFLDNLVDAIDDPHHRITVITTLRADFYGAALEHPEFGARLGEGIINVTALTPGELEDAAVEPARELGVALEPTLVTQLISDVGTEAGALPLFQFALTELYDRRASDTLTSTDYAEMGGLAGALRHRVGDLYESFDSDEQAAARQLFLRLVTVGELDQRSRRRVPAREIASLGVDTVVMQRVIQRMGERRLLSFDADQLTGAPTVEVAHESLLMRWPRLESWVEESREDLRKHASLRVAMREWQLAGRHPEYLMPAARWREFVAWTETSNIDLNDAERGYLEASERRMAEEDARRQDDERARRRLVGLVGALAASLGLAALLILGVFESNPPVVTFFGNDDNGWHTNIQQGLERAARDVGLTLESVAWEIDPGLGLRELVETEPKIVIADGMGLEAYPTALVEHPTVEFGFVDLEVDAPNATYVLFENEEGAYLAGYAAARTSRTGIVGFIGGAPILAIEEFRAGFEAGALAANPDIVVRAIFVNHAADVNGFGRPDIAKAHALRLYRGGADVVFAAAGFSGFGIFDAAAEESAQVSEHLWAIGVDNDQWFDVSPEEQPHVLTSIIKRGDVGSYRLAEHMAAGGPAGPIGTIGLAEGGFDFSTQGDGLSAEVIAELNSVVEDIAEGRVDVPTIPTGEVLIPDDSLQRGLDGLVQFASIDEGTYQLGALGTPIEVTVEGDWWTQVNFAGHTVFTHPNSIRPGDRDVALFRANSLANARSLGASGDLYTSGAVEPWPLDDMDGWLDAVPEGVITDGPRTVNVGGQQATYFEVGPIDPDWCGPAANGYCLGFIANAFDQNGVSSGRSFEVGFINRIWWIESGDYRPLIIIAGTPVDDRSFEAQADSMIDALVIGDPEPHPAPID